MSDEYRTTDLSKFVFDGTHQVRMFVDAQGMPWWVAQDVCAILGLSNITEVLGRLDDDEKDDFISNDVIGRQQALKVVNEYGLYGLILGSRKPQATVFKRWVTHEVLPQIRRTGIYAAPGAQPQLPPRKPATRVEISLHMATVWRLLRSTDEEWDTNRELALETGVSPRAVRSYTRYWLDLGLVERQETFPRHLYRLAVAAERQQARIWQHLDTCTAILIRRAEYSSRREVDAIHLNLPMAKARGFQTPDHSGSRGPFQPRVGSRIAPTPGARVQHLSADARFATPEGDAPRAGVDTEKSTCTATPVLP